MNLDKIFLKRYRAERICDQIFVKRDPAGKYRATDQYKVVRALTASRIPKGVEVLIGNVWHPMKHQNRA